MALGCHFCGLDGVLSTMPCISAPLGCWVMGGWTVARVPKESGVWGRLEAGFPLCTPIWEHACQAGVIRHFGSIVTETYGYNMVLSSAEHLVHRQISWGLWLPHL